MSEVNALAAKRRRARHYALQALYQWTMTGAELAAIEAEFRVDYDFRNVDGEYFTVLLQGVTRQVSELEALFSEALDRGLDELDPIERNLLRMGVFELRDRVDVPYRVVINEYVALAKKFGASESFRYVNGILDKVAKQLRAIEIAADS